MSEKKLKIGKIGEYLAKLEARAWLSHALCELASNTQLKDKESDETITFLLQTLPNIHRFKKNSLTDSAKYICPNRPGSGTYGQACTQNCAIDSYPARIADPSSVACA